MTFNKIGWCHFTVGFWSGCTEVSPACDNCYAREMLQNRFGLVTWGAKQPRRPSLENAAKELRRINNKAKRDGIRYRVFINSASDTFDAEVPDEWRDALFESIRQAPHIDALVLTKRPTLARRYRESGFADEKQAHRTQWPPNLHLGVTIETPQYLWRIGEMPIAGGIRFVSIEPMLATFLPCDVAEIVRRVGWVIVGGERDRDFRAMDMGSVRLVRDACRLAGAPFYFKQMAGVNPKDEQIPEDLRIREFPEGWAQR